MSNETRHIKLPSGLMLELEYSPQFLQKIRKAFDMSEQDVITDEHIRAFMSKALKNALDSHDMH